MDQEFEYLANKLETNKATLLLTNGTEEEYFFEDGIKNLLKIKESKKKYKNWTAFDKKIGKAAAVYLISLGINKIYTYLISEEAINYLTDHKILLEYQDQVKYLPNKKGDGLCPIEVATFDVEPRGVTAAIKRYFTHQNDNKYQVWHHFKELLLLGNSDTKRFLKRKDEWKDFLFDHDPLGILDYDISFLLVQKMYTEARKDLECFKNKPYVNQEVEEAFKYYDRLIDKEEKTFQKFDSLDKLKEIKDKIKNHDYSFINELGVMPEKSFEFIVDDLKNVLAEPLTFHQRRVIWEFLLSYGAKGPIKVSIFGKLYDCKVEDLEKLFTSPYPVYSEKVMLGKTKDVTLANLAKNYTYFYIYAYFPCEVINHQNYDDFFFALAYMLVRDYKFKEYKKVFVRPTSPKQKYFLQDIPSIIESTFE